MKWVLGVDGGNSKTHALICDENGHVVGFAQADGSNHETIGFAGTERVLERVAQDALARSGVSAPIDCGFWCLAGADVDTDFTQLSAIAARIAAARTNVIKNDIAAAMGAGFSRGWGVAVICGAGFSSGGIAPDGRELQFPSLGPATGDWGGGGDIGLEVLRLAHRSYDGRGEPSVLSVQVPHALDIKSLEHIPQQLRAEAIDWDVVRDKLPPLLFAAAAEGDRVAIDLILRIGAEVGTTALAIIQRLAMESLDVELVLSGSLLRSAPALLIDTIDTVVREVVAGVRIIQPEFPPVVGAIFQSLRAIGIEVDERIRSNVRATLVPELTGI